jgi:uroporphyrin-III C-methyltransferase
VKFLTGKRGGRRSMAQSTINRLMVRLARRGLRVVRLKGGDPSIFGRVSEERDFLTAHGVASEIVPGVTAASAAAAQFGFSLTHRDQARRVVLTTARTGDGATADDWRCAADSEATVAVYMGGTRAGDLASRLMQAGRSAATPAIAIESAEGPGARMLFKGVLGDLLDIELAGDGGPILIVVGEVTRRAKALTADVAPPQLLRAAI